jgi:DMSO/TMAO reductase YedYZ heme-binding membrane subunit
LAAAGFLAIALLARASHPGHAGQATGTSNGSSVVQSQVPGVASYRPLAVALGVVAAELLAALAVTNHYRKHLPHKLWRRLHMLNFAVWGLALVHGLTAGTDASTTWALVLYAGSAWLVLALLIHRISLHWETTERRTQWQ